MSVAASRIIAALERHKRVFDLTRDDLGRSLCKAATDEVQKCIDGQHSPDGASWAPLSHDYAEWKGKHFPGEPMAVLHHLMADPDQVAGVVDVTPDVARVTYGVSEDARDEAVWFQQGGGRQPPRPFWGLTQEARDAARKLLDERFKEAFK